MARLKKTIPSCQRGEIWSVDLRPGMGQEVAKIRPALVISHDNINKLSPMVIILPFSSQHYTRLGPERMLILPEESNLAKESVLLITHISAIDKVRLQKKIGKLPQKKLREVEDAIKLVLDLEGEEDVL